MSKIYLNEIETMELLSIVNVVEEFLEMLKQEEAAIRKEANGNTEKDTRKN